MKLSPFLQYALGCNILLLLFLFYKRKEHVTCTHKTEQLKNECYALTEQMQRLSSQLNAIRNRSTVEAYARNRLGMEKVRPNQKRMVENI